VAVVLDLEDRLPPEERLRNRPPLRPSEATMRHRRRRPPRLGRTTTRKCLFTLFRTENLSPQGHKGDLSDLTNSLILDS